MLILVLKNLQLEILSKIKQWFITPHRCSVFMSATPSCPRLSWASVPRSCDPGTETLLCTPLISPCPRLAQHAWIPSAHKGGIQTPRPFLKEAAVTWPLWTNLIVGPCTEPPARCPSIPKGTEPAARPCAKTPRSETQRTLSKMNELGVVYLFTQWFLQGILPINFLKMLTYKLSLFFFFSFFVVHWFWEREEGRRGGREKQPPPGDWVCSPSMCPDWESDPQPSGAQDDVQPTEPHQPGLYSSYFNKKVKQCMSRGRTNASPLKALLGEKRWRAWWLKIDN